MTTLPLLTFDEAQSVGEAMHDHWQRITGDAPIARDNLAWADLVQFVTRKACECVIGRDAGEEGMFRQLRAAASSREIEEV